MYLIYRLAFDSYNLDSLCLSVWIHDIQIDVLLPQFDESYQITIMSVKSMGLELVSYTVIQSILF